MVGEKQAVDTSADRSARVDDDTFALLLRMAVNPQFDADLLKWENELLRQLNLSLQSNQGFVSRKILSDLSEGPKTYTQLLDSFKVKDMFTGRELIVKATHTTLARRLENMAKAQIIKKVKTKGFPPKSEYSLVPNEFREAEAKLYQSEDKLFRITLELLFRYRSYALAIAQVRNTPGAQAAWLTHEALLTKALSYGRKISDEEMKRRIKWVSEPESFRSFLKDEFERFLTEWVDCISWHMGRRTKNLVNFNLDDPGEIVGWCAHMNTEHSVLTLYLYIFLAVIGNICRTAQIPEKEVDELVAKALSSKSPLLTQTVSGSR